MKKPPIGTITWLEHSSGKLNFTEKMKIVFQGIKARSAHLLQGKQLRHVQKLTLEDIVPPDSVICQAADELAKQVQAPYLYHHCVRSYIWARMLNEDAAFDHEAFYVAVMLHDLGLTNTYQSQNSCFTYAASHAARDLAIKHQWSEKRADLVANAISLHLNITIGDEHGREAQLVRIGSGADVVGQKILTIPREQRTAVVNKYPRLDFKKQIIKDLKQACNHSSCRIAFMRSKLGFDNLIKQAPFDD